MRTQPGGGPSPGTQPCWHPKLRHPASRTVENKCLLFKKKTSTLEDLKILANIGQTCGYSRNKPTESQSSPFFSDKEGLETLTTLTPSHTATKPIPWNPIPLDHRGHVNKTKCLSTKSHYHRCVLSSAGEMWQGLLSSSGVQLKEAD